jgi:4-hydroxybenzoate polyprenyltransferase
MASVKNYLSLIKFNHTIFAMPFALIGFFLGVFRGDLTGSQDSLRMKFVAGINPYLAVPVYLILVILCMIFARSAAMAFNRYLDRSFDEKNPRTAIREIPKGIISPNNALRFVILNCILFVTCTFFINIICFLLSPIALFIILFYSYTKRFTSLSHFVLGLGLSLAPIGAYLAVTGRFNILPLLFSFTVLFWVSGFDIIYALQDEEFDKANDLYSMPAVLGKVRALKISELLHVLSALCIIAAGYFAHLGWIYWVGACFFISLLIYQHSLVKPDNLSKVNLAFFTTNGIASVIFFIFVLLDLFINKNVPPSGG